MNDDIMRCSCAHCEWRQRLDNTQGFAALMSEMRDATCAERDSLSQENTRLRSALERIAEYETDWGLGPAQNVANLQEIAERALAPSPRDGG